MRGSKYHMGKLVPAFFIPILLLVTGPLSTNAQAPAKNYTIKDGKMQIELSKKLSQNALDSFIDKFDLYDLDLKELLRTNSTDSLQKLGWKLEKNDRDKLIISKLLGSYGNFDNPAEKIIFAEKKLSFAVRFPVVNSEIKYGHNSFRRKPPFLVKDSIVSFFLRNNLRAKSVMLAGSFNDWDPGRLAMRQTDSGWIANVKLAPGKYWYKFIVDRHWTIDLDNLAVENDGQGNNNSVFFKPNTMFTLNGFPNAKKVFVAGSFNNWKPRELEMVKTAAGWQLPLYLADGTHTYRFVADGQWMTDPGNNDRLPNEFRDFNSVIRIGKPFLFKLTGYSNASEVILSGSFNNWREDELYMNKVNGGWELPYTIGAGNYEYRFKVDGKWVIPAANTGSGSMEKTKSCLILSPNYSFRLKGFSSANSVLLVGDFNDWSPNCFAMKQQDGEWVLRVHLSAGKHLYKFVVDGKWIPDPGNNLIEQTEIGTGNSVIWFDPNRW